MQFEQASCLLLLSQPAPSVRQELSPRLTSFLLESLGRPKPSAPCPCIHPLGLTLCTSWHPYLSSPPPAFSCWNPLQQPIRVSSSGSPCLDPGLTGLSGKQATTGVASCLVARAPALASEERAASYPAKDFLHQFPLPAGISCPTIVPF